MRFHLKDERDRMLLWWYFQVLKEYGDKAHLMPKGYLYEIAGEKVYLTGETAGRIIRKRMKQSTFISSVKELQDINEC